VERREMRLSVAVESGDSLYALLLYDRVTTIIPVALSKFPSKLLSKPLLIPLLMMPLLALLSTRLESAGENLPHCLQEGKKNVCCCSMSPFATNKAN
jgi:hypothetical protein